MCQRPDYTVIRYFLEYADKFRSSEELQAFKVDDYTVKISLLFGSTKYYFEIDNFESEGVTIALYCSDNLHSKNRSLVESKQYTFNMAQSKPVSDFLKILNALNGFFK